MVMPKRFTIDRLESIRHTTLQTSSTTVKLGDKEHFEKEQIGVKEPFYVTNCQFTS
jgi:hypothetical protein